MMAAPAGNAQPLVVSISVFPARFSASRVILVPAAARLPVAVTVLPGSAKMPPVASVLLEVVVPRKAVPWLASSSLAPMLFDAPCRRRA